MCLLFAKSCYTWSSQRKDKKMATYEITATYEVWHRVEVEADSHAEALRLGEQAMMFNGESEEIGGEWQDSVEAELIEEDEDSE